MSVDEWSHVCEFWAYPSHVPGTIRLVVGQAANPHRSMLNLDRFSQQEWDNGQSMTVGEWAHMCDCWVLPIHSGTAGGTPYRLRLVD